MKNSISSLVGLPSRCLLLFAMAYLLFSCGTVKKVSQKNVNRIDSVTNNTTQTQGLTKTDSSGQKRNTISTVLNEQNDYKRIILEGKTIGETFSDGFSLSSRDSATYRQDDAGNSKAPSKTFDFKNFVPERITIELGHQAKEQTTVSDENDSSAVRKTEAVNSTSNQQSDIKKQSTEKTSRVERKGGWPWYVWLLLLILVVYLLYRLYLYLKSKTLFKLF